MQEHGRSTGSSCGAFSSVSSAVVGRSEGLIATSGSTQLRIAVFSLTSSGGRGPNIPPAVHQDRTESTQRAQGIHDLGLKLGPHAS